MQQINIFHPNVFKSSLKIPDTPRTAVKVVTTRVIIFLKIRCLPMIPAEASYHERSHVILLFIFTFYSILKSGFVYLFFEYFYTMVFLLLPKEYFFHHCLFPGGR